MKLATADRWLLRSAARGESRNPYAAGWTLTLLWCLLWSNDGNCGAPFETDDPGTIDQGRVEVLLFYQGTLQAQVRDGSLPGLELHIGLLSGLEFDVVAPVGFSMGGGTAPKRGYGDTTVGVKYRILGETANVPLVSLVPKVVLPTSGSDAFGNGGSQAFLAIAALKNLGNFETYCNVGYWLNTGSNNFDYWFVGAQGQYQLSDAWTLGGELFYKSAQSVSAPASTGFNVGGYYSLGPRSQALFSAGRGLQNAAATNRASTYLGVQIAF